MKRKERRRALAIFMCITMILSMTAYATPVQIATPSNGIHATKSENDGQTINKATSSDANQDESSRASSSDADRNNTDSNQNVCDECHQTGGHADTCSKYVSISEIGNKGTTVDESVIGKTGVIPKGTTVYHEAGQETGLFATWTTLAKYTITIEDAKLVDDEVWYQYRCDSFWDVLSNYSWVKADDVTIESGAPEGDKEVTIGDVVIQISGDEIPDEVSLHVSEVSEEDYHEELGNYVEDQADLLSVYDITLRASGSNAWQPESGDAVTVTLNFPGVKDGTRIGVLHEHGSTLSKMGIYVVENETISFDVYGFSNFYFYITFEYGELQTSLSGMSQMYLSELMQQLNISYGIEDVVDVEFSNPDYIEVVKAEEENDWILYSLQSFGTEETLTITFSDGVYAVIRVKDPVIYNYALSSSGTDKVTNVEMGSTQAHTFNLTGNTDARGDVASANGKTVNVNSNVITWEKIDSIGATSETTDTDIVIYAKEGMAIRFSRNINFATWPTSGSNGVWYFVWDNEYNYVVIDSGNSLGNNSATIHVQTDPGSSTPSQGKHCNIKIVVVSEDASDGPQLLENRLSSINNECNTNYSIKTIPVTLYDYDGYAFNKNYEDNGGNYFAFAGLSQGKNAKDGLTNYGWTTADKQANGGGSSALMGIVKEKLDANGLPQMSQGQNVDLFSKNALNGKTVYSDVGFQFIYNEANGYYNYNSSLNHAQYNSTENVIELYDTSFAPTDTGTYNDHSNAGFYPFADINKAFLNSGRLNLTETQWSNKLESTFELLHAQYASDIVQTDDLKSSMNLHFGLQVSADFYLPESKQIKGQDLAFDFTGDDDLWVFIDNRLVLDVGGGHTQLSGSFNLRTGDVSVENAVALTPTDGGSYENGKTITDSYNAIRDYILTLEGDQMHNIKIFYLERHGGVSNCRMRFNLPLVPSGSVTVSKELKTADGGAFTVTPDTEYEFALYTAESDNDEPVAENQYTPLAIVDYTVKGKNAPTGTQTTDENGKFKLKDGQTAQFDGIERFTNVRVVEYTPEDGYVYLNSQVSVNGNSSSGYTYGSYTDGIVMGLNSISYVFTNYMQTQPLTIQKEVVGGADGLLNRNQEFTFNFVFTKDCVKDDSLDDVTKIAGTGTDGISNPVLSAIPVTNKNSDNSSNDDSGVIYLGGTFKLKQGESITFPRVPVNMTFTLSETNPDGTGASTSWADPTFTPATNGGLLGTAPSLDSSNTLNLDGSLTTKFNTPITWTIVNGTATTDPVGYTARENKITVTNQQFFNLVIEKIVTGEVNPDQSFMFTIKGKDGTHTAGYGTTIVIPSEKFSDSDGDGSGTASITISGLPIGSYTVTEDTEWSWRYKVTNPSDGSVTVIPSASQTASFTNVRSNTKWFDGEAWCKNIFAAKGIDKKTEGSHVTVKPQTTSLHALKPKETEYNF